MNIVGLLVVAIELLNPILFVALQWYGTPDRVASTFSVTFITRVSSVMKLVLISLRSLNHVTVGVGVPETLHKRTKLASVSPKVLNTVECTATSSGIYRN